MSATIIVIFVILPGFLTSNEVDFLSARRDSERFSLLAGAAVANNPFHLLCYTATRGEIFPRGKVKSKKCIFAVWTILQTAPAIKQKSTTCPGSFLVVESCSGKIDQPLALSSGIKSSVERS